jgi:hypothetical protein
MMRYAILASLLVGFLFATFAHCAHLNESEVVALAKEAAERAGYRLENYEEPNVRFELDKTDEWVVTFRSKINPLVHFFVTVDDQTGNTKLMPGE